MLVLTARYRKMAAERTYKMMFPDTDFDVALDGFRGAYIKPVVQKNAELTKQLTPLRLGVERLEFLHQVLCAMLDFVASPAERHAKWNVTEPFVTSPNAYATKFVMPPTPMERDNAEKLRDGIVPRLLQEATAALEWRMSGIAPAGHPDAADLVIARKRNELAMELLQALRTNKIILLLLDEHEHIPAATLSHLEDVIVEAFAQIATAPAALEQLTESELTAIVRISAKGDVDLSRCKPKGPDGKRFVDSLASFIPDNELIETPTELSEKFAKFAGRVDGLTASASLMTRLWVWGAPRVLTKLGSKAKRNALSALLLIRWSMVDATGLDQEAAYKVMDHFVDFAEMKDPKFLSRGLEKTIERTRHARAAGATVWSGIKLLFAAGSLAIAYSETKGDDAEAKKASKSLALALSAIKTAQGTADFLGNTLESSPFIQGRLRNGHELYSGMTTVAGKVAGETLSILDPAIGALEFTAAALAYGEANHAYKAAKKKGHGAGKEEGKVDVAREQAVLAAMGVGVALASLALLTPLPLAGAALMLGGLMLDRGNWDAIGDLASLPGPGRVAKDTFNHLRSAAFKDAIQYAPNRGTIELRLELFEPFLEEHIVAGTGAFWSIGAGQLLSSTARDIMRTQYGFSDEVANVLVLK